MVFSGWLKGWGGKYFNVGDFERRVREGFAEDAEEMQKGKPENAGWRKQSICYLFNSIK